MILWRFSWREWRRRPLRTWLTLLSVIIGVGAVESVALSTDSARRAQKAMLQSVMGRAALEISAAGGAEFDAGIVDKLRDIQDIAAIVPTIHRFCSLTAGDKKARVQVLGIDPRVDRIVRDFQFVQGGDFKSDRQFWLEASFAESLNMGVGDELQIATLRGGFKKSKIAAIIRPTSGSHLSSGSVVMIPIQTAQNWFRSRNRIDSLQIVLQDESKLSAVQATIQEQLPEGLTVRLPQIRSQIADELTLASNQGLMMATGFALVISIFIIYNTFQMNVGERRRQIGMLRALGTTRSQITWMIFREGFLLGLIGSMIGAVIGWYGAALLSKATTDLLQVGPIPQVWSWRAFSFATASGLAVSLIGAYSPARKASRLPPSDAMRPVASTDFEKPSRNMLRLGAAAFLLGFGSLIGCIAGWVPIEHSATAAMVGLLGMILMLPSILEPISRWILQLIYRWLGVPGRLAQRQLMRHVGRSSLTIGILFIAVSTGLGMASTILDNIRDVKRWYAKSLAGDFFVRAAMPDMATGRSADLPMEIVEKIKASSGIVSIDELSFINARSGEWTVLIVARDYHDRHADLFDIVEGEAAGILDKLRDGQVVVGSVLAERSGLKVGSVITLNSLQGEVPLTIAAIVNDYLGGGLTVYLDRSIAETLYEVEGADALIIQAIPERRRELEASLRAICQETGLLFQSYGDLVDYIQKNMDGVVAGLWAVLGLGSLIAAIGLLNTLAMNILEQTREIGLLRVVAMTRSQVRWLILTQAMMMGIIALVPGIVMGVFIAFLLNLSTRPVTGHAIEFVVRPWLIIGVLFAEAAIILVASMVPAERAARLPVSECLHYE